MSIKPNITFHYEATNFSKFFCLTEVPMNKCQTDLKHEQTSWDSFNGMNSSLIV
jgi:hypothetical protein